MKTLPHVGDRVTIPWGLDEVEGRVVSAYNSGRGPQVIIEVLLESSAEPLRVTYPMDAVHLRAAA